ncbi:MAG: malectin [Planctomycetota bacterium]|nr:malectin [Planctomycetota bacterium]
MRRAMLAILVVGLAVGLTGCATGGMSKAVFCVNCGDAKDYTDQAGNVWLADQELTSTSKFGAASGSTVTRDEIKTIAGTPAPQVYRTERYAVDKYVFKLANGTYTARLHFCETFDGITASGERVFTVKVQGKTALADLDVFKEAGGFAKPLIKEVKNVSVTDGKLVIEFEAKAQNTEINGIEILAQ